MDNATILKIVRRVRAENAATDRQLAELQQELEKDQEPAPERKRRNLKADRKADIERIYQTNKSLRRAL